MNLMMMRVLCAAAGLGVATPAQVTWIENPNNGHLYATTPALSWAGAEAYAIAQGGHLVTVRSSLEQTWIYQTFGGAAFWIGFSDAASEGSWSWTSGEGVSYTNWCPGEPNNASNEDYANLSGCGGWNDVEDTILIPGIIELVGPFATYTTFGVGCLGPNGLAPALAPVGGERPLPGSTSHVRLSNLPAAVTIPLFLVGFSDTWDSHGYSLPAALDVLGWTGCCQLTSLDISYLAITATGTVDQALFMPPGTPLGLEFFVQALVLYTPNGVALSNGVAGVVGY